MPSSSPAVSARIRARSGRACAKAWEHLGITIDGAKNKATLGSIAEIQKDGAPVRVRVVRTDKEREIAQQTVLAIEKAK